MIPNIFAVVDEGLRRKAIVLNGIASEGYVGIGERVSFLLKKSSGTRCSCYSVEKGEARFRCVLCYGIGWLGGYDLVQYDLDGNPLYIKINEVKRVLTPDEPGEIVEQSPDFWILTYPILSTGDIIVRKGNLRYMVEGIDADKVAGVLVRQAGNMKELESGHIVYSFEVPFF